MKHLNIRRGLVDLSSLLWTNLLRGKDKEFGREILHEGKKYYVNSAQYCYDNAIDFLTSTMQELGIKPRDLILVMEGMNSKSHRRYIFPGYKADRENDRCPQQYEQFNLAKEMIISAVTSIGGNMCWQDGGVEADDVLGYLAQKLKGEIWIISNDKDLAQLIGNFPESEVHQYRMGIIDQNPFGPFNPRLIPAAIALVGDSADKIPGAKGFGEKTFIKLLETFGEDGLEVMDDLLRERKLHTLVEDVSEMKELQRIIDSADQVYMSYALANLLIKDVDTLRRPLRWRAGMVKPRAQIEDSRLHKFAGVVRLVSAENYDAAKEFLEKNIEKTREFCLDLETSVDEISEEWLETRSKSGIGVDVMGSAITGCGLTFGSNGEYTYYMTVDHVETEGCTNLSIQALADLLALIPQSKITLAHNAAGFELPVMYNHFKDMWANNGWRGFFPNMHDTRIAAVYWNENRQRYGLKELSKELLGYEQETYEHVTTKSLPRSEWDGKGKVVRELYPEDDGVCDEEAYGNKWVAVQYRMNQLTAKEVLSYGADDTICTLALWNFFNLQMEMDGATEAFFNLECKPMYLSAMSYCQGTNIDFERLRKISETLDAKYTRFRETLDNFLIDKGWEGTVTPVYSELTPAAIKEIYQIFNGRELKTMVRTPDKIIKLIEAEDEDNSLLVQLLRDALNGDFSVLNEVVAEKFNGTPQFDTGSSKQVGNLLYGTVGVPIRLRNRPTDVMRAKGIREGTPRTDDDAIRMAIKMGDVVAGSDEESVLKALIELKSIDTKRGLYYEPYPKFVNPKTRKLHPELRQSSTNTRRWTGANPNLQQTDKVTKSSPDSIRQCILPHHRNAVILSLDESAQEVRIMTDRSRDTNLLSCYLGTKEDRKDIHSFVAAMVSGTSYEEFYANKNSEDKDVAAEADAIRGRAKSVFFGQAYGAMAPKIAEGLGISVEGAQKYLDAIYAAFPGLGEWKEAVQTTVEQTGKVHTYRGAVRHLRDALNSDNGYERSKALRQGVNTIIQSSGAEQMKTIMASIWDSSLIEDYDFQWMFCVHDEVICSVAKDQVVPVAKILHEFMTAQFLDVVPSASSIGVGRNFGDLIEIGEEFDAEKLQKAVDAVMAK